MEDRFSDLSEIEYLEYEEIGRLATQFFHPLNCSNFKQFLGKKEEDKITPFSANDFYMFLTKIDKTKYESKIHKIGKILKKMESGGLLVHEGRSHSALLGDCYYAMKELTKCQSKNTLYYAEAFGLPFLREKVKNNTVHIIGKDDQGKWGNGTGFLIDARRILTCKHVVTGMKVNDEIEIAGSSYGFDIKIHENKDVALLVLDNKVEGACSYPSFNNADVLDQVLVLGYPPIPCAGEDYMVSQHGEVISVVYDYLNKVYNIVLSSTTRPGNSGGPVLSKGGYIVGMVTQSSHTKESTDEEYSYKTAPYYMAMNGRELYNAIKEIDSEANIDFEDYQ